MALALALAAGFAAGVINAVAFSGSFLTLPALIWLGLDATSANATNRVGILVAALVASATYRRGGHLPLRRAAPLLVPACAGSVLGALVAARLPAPHFERILAILMLLFLALILAEPGRFLEGGTRRTGGPVVETALFLAIGFYGGFVQAGVGILLLAGLTLVTGLDIVDANGVKNLFALVFTLPALLVFALHRQVHWELGAFMAAGQSAGAYAASRFAVTHPRAPQMLRGLLAIVLLATALRLLATG